MSPRPRSGSRCPARWRPWRGCNHAGWHVVVATNQAGIGRGMIDMAAVNAVHAHMNQLLAAQGGRIDAVFFCPHTPEEACDCRKPKPGMMLEIGRRYGVDLKHGADGRRHAARPARRPGRRLRTAPGADRPRREHRRRPAAPHAGPGAGDAGARRPGGVRRLPAAPRPRRRLRRGGAWPDARCAAGRCVRCCSCSGSPPRWCPGRWRCWCCRSSCAARACTGRPWAGCAWRSGAHA